MKFLRNLKCRLGWCGMIQKCNDTHIWGYCPNCGKVAGIVSRASIRAYMDAEERNRWFDAEQEALRKSIIAQSKAAPQEGTAP